MIKAMPSERGLTRYNFADMCREACSVVAELIPLLQHFVDRGILPGEPALVAGELVRVDPSGGEVDGDRTTAEPPAPPDEITNVGELRRGERARLRPAIDRMRACLGAVEIALDNAGTGPIGSEAAGALVMTANEIAGQIARHDVLGLVRP